MVFRTKPPGSAPDNPAGCLSLQNKTGRCPVSESSFLNAFYHIAGAGVVAGSSIRICAWAAAGQDTAQF
jgi:hypothetical protein